jgi:hypothetical protein
LALYNHYGDWRAAALRFLYRMRYAIGLYDAAMRRTSAERISN